MLSDHRLSLQDVLHKLRCLNGGLVCALELARRLEKLHFKADDSSRNSFKLGQQHDMHEFATKMYDLVHKLDLSGSLKSYFGGTWKQKITLSNGFVASVKDTPFASPSEPTVSRREAASRLLSCLLPSHSLMPSSDESIGHPDCTRRLYPLV